MAIHLGPTELLAFAFVLSVVVEALVEYFVGTPMNKIPKLAPYKWALMYVALGVGIGLAWFFQIDLFAIGFKIEPSSVGMILTGVLIGSGSSKFRQFVSKYLPVPLKRLGDK